ncbi:MAG TPA: hypothetical protein VHQ68_15680 [Propionibacteriaceae bacterium]|nr:hypothetical protein [Propionibacteriaceae bacterium]
MTERVAYHDGPAGQLTQRGCQLLLVGALDREVGERLLDCLALLKRGNGLGELVVELVQLVGSVPSPRS